MVQEVTPRTRASRAQAPSPTEVYLSENEDKQSTTHERAIGGDGEAQNFTHTTANLVVLYFPTPWGWESREVPSTNMRMCINAGARINCGDCGGSCSPDPRNPQYNNCPGREKFMARQCPVCGRLIYDFGGRSVNADLLSDTNALRLEETSGEVLIEDDAYTLATPAARTKAELDRHIFAYHPSEATSLGITDPQPPARNG
jgi:hypothetical protein